MTYKILVVDDDSSTRNLLKIYLSKWGYECTLAVDGAHAWELFQQHPFDIVLSDWLMPGLQGPELCEKIRNYKKGGYTYIILCTIKDNVKNIVEGMESGADDYVTKPFDRNELKVRINAGERVLRLEHSLEKTNARLQRNLRQAAISLESMLPTRSENGLLTVDWFFKPAVYIGGDLFNVFHLNERQTSIFSIDVSGHGVASALFATTLNNMLRPWVSNSESNSKNNKLGNHDLSSPSAVASMLNERFQLEPPADLYFTMFYGVLDHSRKSLQWIRAGHPPAILLRDNQLSILDDGDPPIGFIPEYKFKTYETSLVNGDRLFLYTDGITEAEAPCGTPFGIEKLQNSLRVHNPKKLSSTIQAVKNEILAHRKKQEFKDDLSLLGIELSQESPDKYSI